MKCENDYEKRKEKKSCFGGNNWKVVGSKPSRGGQNFLLARSGNYENISLKKHFLLIMLPSEQ
jgi:hypothetical protein